MLDIHTGTMLSALGSFLIVVGCLICAVSFMRHVYYYEKYKFKELRFKTVASNGESIEIFIFDENGHKVDNAVVVDSLQKNIWSKKDSTVILLGYCVILCGLVFAMHGDIYATCA